MSTCISDLSFSYPNRSSLIEGINLELSARSVTAIIGANGSGKSTLLKLWLGLITPTSGTITINGRQPQLMSPKTRSETVGYLSPETYQSTSFKVREILQLSQNRISKDEYVELNHRLSLESLLDPPFSSLSSGEKRRVMLAQLLAQNADWLLLDEPFTYLDPLQRQGLVETIVWWQSAHDNAWVICTNQPEALAGINYQLLTISEKRCRLHPAGTCWQDTIENEFRPT